jgi:hypothetical protein
LDVFWDVAQFSLVDINRRFRDACCFHYQGITTMLMETVTPVNIPEDSHIRRLENIKYNIF